MPVSLRRTVLICLVCMMALLAACAAPQDAVQPAPANTTAPTTEPQRGDLDPADFAELIVRLRDGQFGEITSLLIVYDNQLIVEEYFSIYRRSDTQHLYSVTKSFVSAAMGIAIDQGYVQDVNDPVLSYYPDYAWLAESDPPAAQMTLDHLLTMQGGYDWTELSSATTAPNADVLGLINSGDYVSYSFTRQRITDPGTRFAYGSYAPDILSGVITRQTDQNTEDFLAEHLFAPLDIETWTWEQDSQSVTNGGWGLYLAPLDMLKFGVLYLNEGQWQGEQIVSPEWVAESTRSHVNVGSTREYGYLWWRFPDDSPVGSRLEPNDAYFGAGLGGQYILVVPHLDMVVVSTAQNFGNDRFPDILKDFIVPIAERAATS